jgi:dienelactone hydrolase
VELLVAPVDGLVDAAPTVTVTGVPPGTPVTLTIRTTDAAGHPWCSSGSYPVGSDGSLQIDDPERPWWDMRFDDPDAVPVAFTAPDSALDYRASVSCVSGSTECVIRRRWNSGDTRIELAGDGWRLRIYRPSGTAESRPGVLVLPGSTGMSAMAPTAALLATHGYTAGVLGYMQEPGLPPSFRRIPVETIVAAAKAFAGAPPVDADRVVILAVSVGTAAALAALGGDGAPQVRGVVIVSPTHVVWQAIGAHGRPPKGSMLTRNGEDLPYVPLRGDKLIGQMLRNALARRLSRGPRSSALRLLPAYSAALARVDVVTSAALPVERIAAPLLAIAGTDDAMWPSATMAEALIQRRRAHDAGDGDRFLVLPGAGHFLRPPVTPTTVDRNDTLISGGTPHHTARGQRAAWDATLKFLTATTHNT